MVHVALFGTSADPPTAGHQAILRWLARTFDQVAVWASDNPFKSHQTPLQHRAAMLQLLIDDIEPPCTNIHYYADLSHPRTLTTVEHARRRWGSLGRSGVCRIGSRLYVTAAGSDDRRLAGRVRSRTAVDRIGCDGWIGSAAICHASRYGLDSSCCFSPGR